MTQEKSIMYQLNEVALVAQEYIVPLMKDYNIFTFRGPLGAGKTTLIKSVLRQCGVKESVTSPTFAYLNMYHNDREQSFHHFDLYRMTSLQDFLDAGFDEMLQSSDSWCFIEWPQLIEPILAEKALAKLVCKVSLSYEPSDLSMRHALFSLPKTATKKKKVL